MLASQLLAKLPAPQQIQQEQFENPLSHIDICDYLETRFYVQKNELIRLSLHQKGILRFALQRDPVSGRFVYTTTIYSTPKKSGKSTIAGGVAEWTAETQTWGGEIYAIGNDHEQARERSFKEVRRSLELTPGYLPGRKTLPGRWNVFTNSLRCLTTNSKIEALAVDARGEAGGHPALSIWTELWGFVHEGALRFWDELTRDPTQPDSIRWVETYAGYDGESMLLYGLYETVVMNGRDHVDGARQLTNHEFSLAVCRDKDGERYDDFLHAFEETNGDPNALIPLYTKDDAGMFAYWDEGEVARRMPWQRGELGDRYYREEAGTLLPKAFRRFHLNEWVSAESSFVPIELWDACYDPELGEVEGRDQATGRRGEPMVVGVDAAATGDCFAIVGVTRHPKDKTRPAIRKMKVWTPSEFPDGRIDFSVPEEFLRTICKHYNIVQIAYDPHQLEDMMQRLRRESVAWCEQFGQGMQRLDADRALYDSIMQRKLAHSSPPPGSGIHTGQEEIRQHILNANAKMQKDEDSKLRIIKKAAGRKIDLAVAASMACARVMYLNL